jgi:hypothetical protein
MSKIGVRINDNLLFLLKMRPSEKSFIITGTSKNYPQEEPMIKVKRQS